MHTSVFRLRARPGRGRFRRDPRLRRRVAAVLAVAMAASLQLGFTSAQAVAAPADGTYKWRCSTAVSQQDDGTYVFGQTTCVPDSPTPPPPAVEPPRFPVGQVVPPALYDDYTPDLPANPPVPSGLELTPEDIDRLLAAAAAEMPYRACSSDPADVITEAEVQALTAGGYLPPGDPCDVPNHLRQQLDSCLNGIGDLIGAVGETLKGLLDLNLTLMPADQAVAPAVEDVKRFIQDPLNFKKARQDPAGWLCQQAAGLAAGKAIGAVGDEVAAIRNTSILDDTAVLRTLTDDEAARIVGGGPVRKFGGDTIAAEKWAEPLWRDYLSTLTREQYEAMLYYKGWPTHPGATQWQTSAQTLSGYKRINDYLRTGQPPSDPAIPGIVSSLDEAIAGSVLPEAVEVYFGLRSPDLFNRGAGTIGGVLDDAGFRSTTLSEQVAGSFALKDMTLSGANHPVIVRLTLPQGSRGLYMDVDNLGFAQQWGLLQHMKAGEAELLLPRNSAIRITGAELKPGVGNLNVKDGILYLDGELIQP